MNENFKEVHLRSLYKLLGHNGHYSRVGSLDFSQKVINPQTGKESYLYEEEYIQGEEALIEYASRYNGKRNIFIGRAYRDSSGAVLGSWVITLDLDPVRPKDTASTDEQHNEALNAGRKILGRYPGGYLASSGNGALLLYRLTAPITGGLKEHYEKEKILFQELQELIGQNIKLDATYYSQAVIKAIGTHSTKGECRQRRTSRFINPVVLPFQRCEKLLQKVREISPECRTSLPVLDVKRLASAFNGDRSIADYHLVNYLKKSGVSAPEALAALQANPIGRQRDEKDQGRLIAKIYGVDAISVNAPKGSYSDRLFTEDSSTGKVLRTGIEGLDRALGPLPSGELTTIAARSGFGKSSFACTLTEHWRQQGYRVLYFSTEMSEFYITHKLVSIATDITLQKFIDKSFVAADRQRICEYEQQLLRSHVIFCDEFQPTAELVANKIHQHTPDIVVFDHITQSGTHWETIAQFSRALKDTALKENIPVLNLVMLDEPGKDNKGNELQSVRGDVRGSKEILFLSAIFAVMSNPYPVKGNIQPVNLEIAKNRFGLSGLIIPISVNKSTGKFGEGIGEYDRQTD